MKTISLNGTWSFKATDPHRMLPSGRSDVTRWMKASVPGTVHTDLLACRRIADPYYRRNELGVQWIDTVQWLYRKEFVVTASFLRADIVELVAEGLDTYAKISINGTTIAETANMFIGHRFNVKSHLCQGKNVIEIIFDSPTSRSKQLEKKFGALRVALEPHRVYVRKAQYSFGWDWGPKLTTSGIWRSISLEASSNARLRDPFVKVVSVNRRKAVLRASINVDRFGDVPLTLRVDVRGHGAFIACHSAVKGGAAGMEILIPSPHLWWPNGYGGQPIYSAVFTLMNGDDEIDRVEVPFAVRTVKLLQEEDREGRSFIFEINNVRIFCKGADWIPSDNFIPRISPSTYETLLKLARDAHMNMIRVWGGGIYEQEIFYDLCDRLGLMVWQDFMHACGEYPETSSFLREAGHEAEAVVKRLRNHPSIVLWCGNNECEWLFCTENPGKGPDEMNGSVIFRKILPQVCRSFDGTRPYWRSSPFGSGFPNAESDGNHHQWIVWSFWKDYPEYERDYGRFVTEFGFQAPANRRTFEHVTLPSDRYPQSRVMEHHNKQTEGTERLVRFQAAHYRIAGSFDEFIYKGQLVQAEALKCAVEHWRRRKFRTAGALFWQLNDCWPVSSWAVIDSALRPKAAYYYAKRFFSPVLVSFKKTANALEVWVTNDLLIPIVGKLVLRHRSFSGAIHSEKVMKISVSSNRSRLVFGVGDDVLSHLDAEAQYYSAQLAVDGRVVSENRFFFNEPKHLRLPATRITSRVKRMKNGLVMLALRANKFAKHVRIELKGEDVVFSDNYFDIDAGGIKTIEFASTHSLRDLKQKIKLSWLR